MRAVILAIGSRGDVQPNIALAQRLQQCGWDSVILALDDFAPLAAAAGVRFQTLGARLPRIDESSRFYSAVLAQAHRNQILAVEAVQAWLRRIAPTIASTIVDSVRPDDLLVTGIMGIDGALLLRQALGCRVAAAVFAPCLPTAHGPSTIAAINTDRTTHLNRLASNVAWAVGLRWSRPLARAIADAVSLSMNRRLFSLPQRDCPILVSASTALVPAASDWPAAVQLTDAWAVNDQTESSPDEQVNKFLLNGTPPIYIGFGSIGHASDTRLFSDAAAKVGQTRIVAALPRESPLDTHLASDNLLMVRDVPHAWLLPRTSGVIHHGSSGTTAAALRAGVPSTAIPHQFDQKYFARRLSTLCVGPAPVARHRLNAERLAKFVMDMTASPDTQAYRAAARSTGRAINVHDGTVVAEQILRRVVGG